MFLAEQKKYGLEQGFSTFFAGRTPLSSWSVFRTPSSLMKFFCIWFIYTLFLDYFSWQQYLKKKAN